MKYVKFAALPDTWYKEGTEAFIDDSSVKVPNVPIKRYTEEEWNADIIRTDGWSSRCFVGLREYDDGVIGIDGEVCSLDEFNIEFVDEPLIFNSREELKSLYNL